MVPTVLKNGHSGAMAAQVEWFDSLARNRAVSSMASQLTAQRYRQSAVRLWLLLFFPLSLWYPLLELDVVVPRVGLGVIVFIASDGHRDAVRESSTTRLVAFVLDEVSALAALRHSLYGHEA